MLDTIKTEQVLFLDIETVPAVAEYSMLTDGIKKQWDKKASYLAKEKEDTPETLYKRAGIYAEFGRIVCISAGMIFHKENKRWFRIKSFYDDDEPALLQNFCQMLNKFLSRGQGFLCAHNGKEFDFPYIARRLLINHLALPPVFNTAGRKPWEVPYLDTLELWKFGDHKHYTSLDLLAQIFGLPDPKSDIDGSMVGEVYWKSHELSRIIEYCQRDVATVARLFMCFKGEEPISDEHIEMAETIN